MATAATATASKKRKTTATAATGIRPSESLPDTRAECAEVVQRLCDRLSALSSRLNARHRLMAGSNSSATVAIHSVSLFAATMNKLLDDVLCHRAAKSVPIPPAAVTTGATAIDTKAAATAPVVAPIAAAAAAAASSSIGVVVVTPPLLKGRSLSQVSTDDEPNIGDDKDDDDDNAVLATNEQIVEIFNELHNELSQSFPFTKTVRFRKPTAADVHHLVD